MYKISKAHATYWSTTHFKVKDIYTSWRRKGKDLNGTKWWVTHENGDTKWMATKWWMEHENVDAKWMEHENVDAKWWMTHESSNDLNCEHNAQSELQGWRQSSDEDEDGGTSERKTLAMRHMRSENNECKRKGKVV